MQAFQVYTHDSQSMALNYISQRLIKANHKALYFLPLSHQGQTYILTHFLPTHLSLKCDQALLLQLWQPSLFTDTKHVARFLM